jgi:hypothetical protein
MNQSKVDTRRRIMQDGKEIRDRPIVFGAQDKLPELTLQELIVMQE